jgi:DNA-binding transcriptional LysR family regulator
VELRQLEYFVAVAEHLHFGRAAEALTIGQPAVSQQLARLERELGVGLLDRSSRRVRLTPAGSRFLPEARAVLAAVERARLRAVDAAPRRITTLRIGSSAGLGDRLARVLAELEAMEPPVVATLVTAPTRARLERVAAGQLDAAFVRGVSSASGVELIEMWEDRLLVLLPARHELADRDVVPLTELAGLPLRIVARRANPPLVDLVMAACANAGFTPRLADYPEAVQDVLAAVASGPPSWTVLYEAHARMLRSGRVAFRATDPPLSLMTALAVPEAATTASLAPLLKACATAALESGPEDGPEIDHGR